MNPPSITKGHFKRATLLPAILSKKIAAIFFLPALWQQHETTRTILLLSTKFDRFAFDLLLCLKWPFLRVHQGVENIPRLILI